MLKTSYPDLFFLNFIVEWISFQTRNWDAGCTRVRQGESDDVSKLIQMTIFLKNWPITDCPMTFPRTKPIVLSRMSPRSKKPNEKVYWHTSIIRIAPIKRVNFFQEKGTSNPRGKNNKRLKTKTAGLRKRSCVKVEKRFQLKPLTPILLKNRR